MNSSSWLFQEAAELYQVTLATGVKRRKVGSPFSLICLCFCPYFDILTVSATLKNVTTIYTHTKEIQRWRRFIISRAHNSEHVRVKHAQLGSVIVFKSIHRMRLISTPQLFCAWRSGRKSSGEPWNKIVSDWFQQKTINVFLIGPFKFARARVNVWRVWRVSGFFPRNVEVLKHDPPILDFSDYKTTLAQIIRQNNWIPQFSNKIP